MNQQLLPFWMDFDKLKKKKKHKHVSFKNHLSSKARTLKTKKERAIFPGEIIQAFQNLYTLTFMKASEVYL